MYYVNCNFFRKGQQRLLVFSLQKSLHFYLSKEKKEGFNKGRADKTKSNVLFYIYLRKPVCEIFIILLNDI